ncbi:STAS domain-containing protein [Noviherbaspirillum denitrificans]|uniref:Anti-anti-sigma factor n=1 Tax=Noviherbaspirillum denitrificans TaxID=1968433 RepID=A0A254TBU8_9BURK|nr:STAS domain-containing protein [Noviherbaspirillum denitrificans]OWW20025.1 anti-anti-sigma factor [Noviherbaspirillum denitrificans]
MSYRPAQSLTVHDAQSVLDDGLRAIAGGQTEIDLAELTLVDSAAVATMLAWQRAAHRDGKSLVFRNLPANLQSLVHLYGVDELLHTVPRTDLPHH